jgi:hypothetical protein
LAIHILIDGWTFKPRAGVCAVKPISGMCSEPVAFPGRLAASAPMTLRDEKMALTVGLKKQGNHSPDLALQWRSAMGSMSRRIGEHATGAVRGSLFSCRTDS